MKIGMVFPGYGSQTVGMCKEIYDSSRVMQEIFEEASNCLNMNFVKLCFASSDIELSKLSNAYPAVFVVSCALAKVLEDAGIKPTAVAGMHIGEFSALFANGALTFPDGLYALRKYACAFESLLEEMGSVKTVTLNNVAYESVVTACQTVSQKGSFVSIATIYSDTALVVGGLRSAVDEVCALVGARTRTKVREVSPGVGLQSMLMDPVLARLQTYLEKIDFCDPKVPFLSLMHTQDLCDAKDLCKVLLSQISHTIDWRLTVARLRGYDYIIESGPGNSLRSYLEQALPETKILSFHTLHDLYEIQKEFNIDALNLEPMYEPV